MGVLPASRAMPRTIRMNAHETWRLVGDEAEIVPRDDLAQLGVRLRARARALGADTHEADDLAQQAIAAVLARDPDQLSNPAYMARTLTRLWLDRQRTLRVRARRLAAVAARAAFRASHTSHAPDEREARLVRDAIERLPPKQRAALVLRVVEGLTHAQIAEAIGCSVEAARASLHEARRAVAQTLRAQGIDR